ncbi:putative Heat shock 70 kDa protein 5 [Hypsibius exemplaris]|uniref:Heat shock 70 kDa protein 5 n=1 Tax=Hypsibius exemplaris TaxID=2072580 RepID=A0A1W0XA77_HYPEX|nr:putative Heat shock 70 kDa protein 5 [Hypsibius exemplaris]
MPVQDVAIGIDLGTTNSSIAVCYKDGRVVVIPNDQTGSRLTPSYVAFDEGTHTVGERAKESPHENAKNTIFQMKRIIGRKYGDAEVVRNKELWPFQLRCGEDGHTPMVVINDLDEEMLLSPVAISALVLKSLKSSAEAFLGQPIDQVVITVPARFTDAQRKATKEAGAQAGLNVIGMINEPTAAAIGYEIEEH